MKCPFCGGELDYRTMMRVERLPPHPFPLAPKPQRLCDLRPGQRFRSEGVTGTLLKINSCRAVVKLDGRSKVVSFVAPDGTEREFTASGDRVQSWSRNSEIDEVIE